MAKFCAECGAQLEDDAQFCGSCGAPSCRAFAEDVVKREANLDDCLIRQHRLKEGAGGNDG